MTRKKLTGLLLVLLASLACGLDAMSADRGQIASIEQLHGLQLYIRQGWTVLRRSNRDLFSAAVDPKSDTKQSWPVYISSSENLERLRKELQTLLPDGDASRIDLRPLPDQIDGLEEHGLLYLPHPYVVPGGRFNEMYGWDSYFILLGLLQDRDVIMARNMVENQLYQIENYGKILNANRTYYLTRSQPPFLTRMILEVFQTTQDRAWLERTLPGIEKTYRFWTQPPHLTPQTGLSRYYGLGRGPAPEVLTGERDERGRTHYDRVLDYFRTHEVSDDDVNLYYDRPCDRLTDLFYVGDRSMRESGFDPSNRFGPFSVDIIHYNPVCLNTLLYQMEVDTADILRILGKGKEAVEWTERAETRRRSINTYLWDEKAGLYFDYHIPTGARRDYTFATTFYPMWAGVASREQARRIVANLPRLERAGGVMTSARVSGSQWDAPFGWAPLHVLAVKGLRRYGYVDEADRITINFLSLILKEFLEHNAILEKYDVVRRDSDVTSGIRFGYASNEIGFGWTNGAFLELYDDLPEPRRKQVLRLSGVPVPDVRKRSPVAVWE